MVYIERDTRERLIGKNIYRERLIGIYIERYERERLIGI